MQGENILYRSDDSFEKYYPKGQLFTIKELQDAVGGDFYLVATDLQDKFFVVNRKNNTEVLNYNINANYLYRRSVHNDKVLKGNVLLCNRAFLEETHIAEFKG